MASYLQLPAGRSPGPDAFSPEGSFSILFALDVRNTLGVTQRCIATNGNAAPGWLIMQSYADLYVKVWKSVGVYTEKTVSNVFAPLTVDPAPHNRQTLKLIAVVYDQDALELKVHWIDKYHTVQSVTESAAVNSVRACSEGVTLGALYDGTGAFAGSYSWFSFYDGIVISAADVTDLWAETKSPVDDFSPMCFMDFSQSPATDVTSQIGGFRFDVTNNKNMRRVATSDITPWKLNTGSTDINKVVEPAATTNFTPSGSFTWMAKVSCRELKYNGERIHPVVYKGETIGGVTHHDAFSMGVYHGTGDDLPNEEEPYPPQRWGAFISKNGNTGPGSSVRILSDFDNKVPLGPTVILAAIYTYVGDGTSIISLYVDGMLVATTDTAPGPMWDGSTKVMFGSDYSGSVTPCGFKGLIYWTAYWDNDYLAPQEMAQIAAGTLQPWELSYPPKMFTTIRGDYSSSNLAGTDIGGYAFNSGGAGTLYGYEEANPVPLFSGWLSSNVVQCFPFNGAFGDVYSQRVGSTYQGTPAVGSTAKFPGWQSLELNGTSSLYLYQSGGSAKSFTTSQNWSVAVWLRHYAGSWQTWEGLVGSPSDGLWAQSGTIWMYPALNNPNALSTNVWHLIVFTHNGSTNANNLVIDGNWAGRASNTTITSATFTWAGGYTPYCFYGYMNQVVTWNRELSQSDISLLWASSAGMQYY